MNCPTTHPFVLNDNVCYLFQNAPHLALHECYMHCATIRAGMLCPRSVKDDLFVFTQENSNASWIGLIKGSDGDTFNSLGQFGCSTSYRNFALTEGADVSERGVAQVHGLHGQWADILEDNSNVKCICQVEATVKYTAAEKPEALSVEPLTSGYTCPQGHAYILNGYKCYLFQNAPTLTTLAECNTYCQNVGAGMLCPQNAAEDSYIYSHRTVPEYWLGLTKIPGTSTIIGVPQSGCSTSYRNFGPGEGYNPAELGVAQSLWQNGGQWADYPADTFHLTCYCQTWATLASDPTAEPTAASSLFYVNEFPHQTGTILNSNNALDNYGLACASACPQDSLTFSGCESSDGDTYFRLFDGNSEVADNDDGCENSVSSQILYDVPAGGECRLFCLHMGCYGSTPCSSYVIFERNGAVEAPTLSPSESTSSKSSTEVVGIVVGVVVGCILLAWVVYWRTRYHYDLGGVSSPISFANTSHNGASSLAERTVPPAAVSQSNIGVVVPPSSPSAPPMEVQMTAPQVWLTPAAQGVFGDYAPSYGYSGLPQSGMAEATAVRVYDEHAYRNMPVADVHLGSHNQV